jgi:hypothetical protein
MIRIDGRYPVAGAGAQGTPRTGQTGSRFTLPGTVAKAESARTSATHSTVSLDSLVALQANEDATERKKRQAKRGHDLLDGLDRLKASLLSGRVSISDLERIRTNLSARRENTDDPRLDDVLAHIELRAAVELAKLGR